jgi:hypothetical protein
MLDGLIPCVLEPDNIVRVALLTPLPNTQFFHSLKKQERILTFDWGLLYDTGHTTEATIIKSLQIYCLRNKKIYGTGALHILDEIRVTNLIQTSYS